MMSDLGRWSAPGHIGARNFDVLHFHHRDNAAELEHDARETGSLPHCGIFPGKDGNGLTHKTAWAGAGDGVLFFDPDNLGTIEEKRQYVFTEWDPTATSDMEALRSVFDSNGDGVFDANDEEWVRFKVMLTNADGSKTAQTLTQLGITLIDLTADATNIELPDGSVITGETTFTWADGLTDGAADMALANDAGGYPVRCAA